MNFDTSWEQIAQNTVDVRAGFLVRRDVFRIAGGSEISVTDKSSAGGKVSYENTNYKRTGFDDSKITTIPVNYYYKVTPKLDVSGGIQFRDTRLTTGVDSQDYFYNVGLRGEFTPKLTGKVAVGYTTRNSTWVRTRTPLVSIPASLMPLTRRHPSALASPMISA